MDVHGLGGVFQGTVMRKINLKELQLFFGGLLKDIVHKGLPDVIRDHFEQKFNGDVCDITEFHVLILRVPAGGTGVVVGVAELVNTSKFAETGVDLPFIPVYKVICAETAEGFAVQKSDPFVGIKVAGSRWS